MMRARKVSVEAAIAIIVFVTALCVAAVGLVAEVMADTTQATQLLLSLRGAQIKIKDTRTIVVWYAVAGQPAECWTFHAPQTLAALNKQGYEFQDWTIGGREATNGLTQSDCFSLPVQ